MGPAKSNHFRWVFRLSDYGPDSVPDVADAASGNGEHKTKIRTEQKGHFKLRVTTVTSLVSQDFSTKPQQLYLNNSEALARQSAVLSLPVLRERWIWTEPLPPPSHDKQQWQHMLNPLRRWQSSQWSTWSPELQEPSWLSQTAFCPRPLQQHKLFHAPTSSWKEPVIYRKARSSPVSVSSLRTIGFSRNFLAAPCPASGNLVRSLCWKSLDILQLCWRVLCPIQKIGNILGWIQ